MYAELHGFESVATSHGHNHRLLTCGHRLIVKNSAAETLKACWRSSDVRKVLARVADLRDVSQLQFAVAEATSALGPTDIVVANAGIAAMGGKGDPDTMFRQIVDVNLVGVWNTVIAAAPSMQEAGKGGAIVLISSTLGLKGTGGD